MITDSAPSEKEEVDKLYIYWSLPPLSILRYPPAAASGRGGKPAALPGKEEDRGAHRGAQKGWAIWWTIGGDRCSGGGSHKHQPPPMDFNEAAQNSWEGGGEVAFSCFIERHTGISVPAADPTTPPTTPDCQISPGTNQGQIIHGCSVGQSTVPPPSGAHVQLTPCTHGWYTTVPQFESQPGYYLHRAYMSSLWLQTFPLRTPVYSHTPKTCWLYLYVCMWSRILRL